MLPPFPHVILSVSEISCFTFLVILSVSEISCFSFLVILSAAKYPTTEVKSICTVSSSVGFFTIVQNDVILLPSREFASSLRFLAKTVKFLCHRERSVAIPLRKYAICTPFFIPTDCRGTSCLATTIKAGKANFRLARLQLLLTALYAVSFLSSTTPSLPPSTGLSSPPFSVKTPFSSKVNSPKPTIENVLFTASY